MSVNSRARLVAKRLPWRSYQTLLQQLGPVRPDEEGTFVAAALQRDVPGMPFSDLVRWTQHLSRAEEDMTPGADRAHHVAQFLAAITDNLQVARLYTLSRVGRDKEDDPPTVFRRLANERADRNTMTQAMIATSQLDQHLARGLAVLKELDTDPNGPWHLRVPIDPRPTDFVLRGHSYGRHRAQGDPMPYRELRDLIDDVGAERLLVKNSDPSMGPFTACIYVKESAVAHWYRLGYRALDDYERHAAEPAIEDYTEGWKHSEH